MSKTVRHKGGDTKVKAFLMLTAPMQHTVIWWTRLLKDEAAMIAWLQKLQCTELEGYVDNIQADAKWNTLKVDKNARKVFQTTAKDEQRHSDRLIKLIRSRGFEPWQQIGGVSKYWTKMEAGITDLASCCAVFALGEHIAADRFQIIAHHEETPLDIREVISYILPDERYHARVFRDLTDPVTMSRIIKLHEIVLQDLITKKGK